MFFLNKPFRSLDKARRDKWTNTVESLEFKKSSRKAQSFLRNPRDDNHAVHPTDIRPNKVASHIVSISRGKSIEQFTIKVKKQPRHLELTSPEESTFSYPFTKEEVNTAIEDIMSGKAPGLNGTHSEFLIHCGKSARVWLSNIYTSILQSGQLPRKPKQTNIIAILKPGKEADNPKSYHPIALLRATYEILERLVLNRINPINPTLSCSIPIGQAGF